MVMAAALVGPHIQAKHYRKDRERMKFGRVVFLGVHTAEGGSKAEDLGSYFRTTARTVSSHAGIGQDGHYVEYVDYADTAFTMAPANDDADNLELLGFAVWDRAEWLTHAPLLETFARWLAWRSEVRDVPLRLLTAPEALKGTPGILMHRTVTEAWPAISNHTDPGVNLPWDVVLKRAKELQMPEVPDYDPARDPFEQDRLSTAPLSEETFKAAGGRMTAGGHLRLIETRLARIEQKLDRLLKEK